MEENKSTQLQIEIRFNEILHEMIFLRSKIVSPNELLVEFSKEKTSKKIGDKIRLYVRSESELDFSIEDLRPEIESS